MLIKSIIQKMAEIQVKMDHTIVFDQTTDFFIDTI